VKILVTGATGFVGSALLKRFDSECVSVRAAARFCPNDLPTSADFLKIDDLSSGFDWSPGLMGIDVVVHTVARVHVMRDKASDAMSAYRMLNVDATLNLARQAASAGVSRFVFLSSIKVNGESTKGNRVFTADDIPAPIDSYGISKLEAEQGLHEIALQTGMQIVLIRSPLIYGPGVKANFQEMMRWLSFGIPLPFGAVQKNRRSLVALDNLVDLICVCVQHPDAANQIFLVSDDEDLSTTDLLRRLANALGKPACLIPVPVMLMQWIAAAVGKKTLATRLCESLQLDISKTRRLLGWSPVVNTDTGLQLAANYFNKMH
jgi:nucleoside-diphosphate-sugar epimerase